MTGRESEITISTVPHRRGMKTVGILPDHAGRKTKKSGELIGI